MRKIHTIRYTRNFDERNIDLNTIRNLIRKHESDVLPDLIRKRKYYDGKHRILKSERIKGAPNAKPVCNHAKDISDTAAGYFMGSPITYKNTHEDDHDIDPLLKAFDQAETDEIDSSLALDTSIYGIAFEYIYAKEGEVELSSRVLWPENTFIVRDGTIEEKRLFAVYYYQYEDDADGKEYYKAVVVTQHYKYTLDLAYSDDSIENIIPGPEEHHMIDLPIIEYRNNRDCIGDFEQQIALIDSYNELMADRINDKKQFVDAILVLYGSQLGDDDESTEKAQKTLREHKILELPDGAKAEYLVRTLEESGTEILRKTIKEDIYTFSHIPNLSDENFVGNSSGVAMEFKLLGMEMHTKIKTRYFVKGLHKRIKIFCDYLGLLDLCMESKCIVPVFSRSLPKNLLELSQIVTNLKGSVSVSTLIRQIPFVEDPEKELEEIKEEERENANKQKELFGITENTPPDSKDEETKKKVV